MLYLPHGDLHQGDDMFAYKAGAEMTGGSSRCATGFMPPICCSAEPLRCGSKSRKNDQMGTTRQMFMCP